jgi:hypothetical protein
VPEHGHRLFITSRSLSELEAILRPVLKQYGLDAEGRHAIVILEQLRSLSGRLALKLVSSPTARAEALGIALARLYLNYQGALRNQIVVPLDAHLDLFHSISQIILHKFNSPSWLKHIQKANAALESLTPVGLSALGPGEAYVWSSEATDDAFSKGAVKIRCSPRTTQHGGGTKTAMR